MLAFCALMLLSACNSSKQVTEPQPQISGRQSGGGAPNGPPSAASVIARLDANSDGKLSIDEVSGRLKDNFSKVDSNSDGFLTKSEIETNRLTEGKRPRRS